jgi:hypothetical protein
MELSMEYEAARMVMKISIRRLDESIDKRCNHFRTDDRLYAVRTQASSPRDRRLLDRISCPGHRHQYKCLMVARWRMARAKSRRNLGRGAYSRACAYRKLNRGKGI